MNLTQRDGEKDRRKIIGEGRGEKVSVRESIIPKR